LILKVTNFILTRKNLCTKYIEFFPETWKDATPKILLQ